MSAPVEVMSGGELLIRSPEYVRMIGTALKRVISTGGRDGIRPTPALQE